MSLGPSQAPHPSISAVGGPPQPHPGLTGNPLPGAGRASLGCGTLCQGSETWPGVSSALGVACPGPQKLQGPDLRSLSPPADPGLTERRAERGRYAGEDVGVTHVTRRHTPCPDTLVDFRATPDTLEILPGHCLYCQSPRRAAQLKHPQHRGPCLAQRRCPAFVTPLDVCHRRPDQWISEGRGEGGDSSHRWEGKRGRRSGGREGESNSERATGWRE